MYTSLPQEFKEMIKIDVERTINPVGKSHHITKNDIIRLMHLRVDPSAATIWTSALCPMTHEELDESHSKSGVADAHTTMTY